MLVSLTGRQTMFKEEPKIYAVEPCVGVGQASRTLTLSFCLSYKGVISLCSK